MEHTSLYFVYALILCLCIGIRAVPIAVKSTADGFWLDNLSPRKTFSFGVVPQKHGQDMSMSFYDLSVSSSGCDDLRVDVYDDGYVKTEFSRIAVLCDKESLLKFTAVSDKGFSIEVHTGTGTNSGALKARFQAASGFKVTKELLY